MRYPDYAKCQIRSIYMARGLREHGYTPSVIYGIYTPSTARKTWDERWQKGKGSEFLHCWVEVEDWFFDCSLFQFGEQRFLWSVPADTHYQKLGVVDTETGEVFFTENQVVLWETYQVKDGCPTLELAPVFI